MKITVLIPEDIISATKKYSGGKNITESLLIALNDYIDRQRIKKSIIKLKGRPLSFSKDYTAQRVRSLNRKRHVSGNNDLFVQERKTQG